MTVQLFRDDATLKTCAAKVVAVDGEGVALDQTVFYATAGGQPGDTGRMIWEGGEAIIINTTKGAAPDAIRHIIAQGTTPPPIGQEVSLALDWDRRWAHMRMHTALHLLSVVIPLPVTGGSIGAEKSRLDFDMPEAPGDKEQLNDRLNEMIAAHYAVTAQWITDAELEANPDLVKTMAVKPPMGQGKVRLIRIANSNETVDLQPCGGTHVTNTGDIGAIRIGKIEKKGKRNRRVNIHFA